MTVSRIASLEDFKALDPFFRIIEDGLRGIADGDHFFDLLADDAVFEYVITVPGYPRRVVGRTAVIELYRPYGDTFLLDRCFDLAVHHDRETGVVVLEYASEGRVVHSGAAYANRYISVVTVVDRKVTKWRDYLDPIAVFDAIGGQATIEAATASRLSRRRSRIESRPVAPFTRPTSGSATAVPLASPRRRRRRRSSSGSSRSRPDAWSAWLQTDSLLPPSAAQ